jgi:hypothetical protein
MALALSALFLGTAWVAKIDEADKKQPNPKAPPETAQYAFLIGEWDCRIESMAPDGSMTEGRARWKGYYILDGWAIQDEWVSETPSGEEFYGTNIRSFDPERKKWNNRWLPSGSLKWKHFDSEQIGDTMVMIGGEGRDPIGPVDRNTFYNISEDHFDWKKDRSYDGGKTWIEGVALISADRIRAE